MKKAVAITLADIKTGNFEAIRKAGLQPLTPDELAQLAQDANEHEAYVATNGYKDERRAEYPPITDQLDALMKYVAQLDSKSIPPELAEIAAQCMAVKAKYPKPE